MLGHRECDGTCRQGEGDCDRDEDCLPGLVCNFDWWFGTDTCQAGKFHSIHTNLTYESRSFDFVRTHHQELLVGRLE